MKGQADGQCRRIWRAYEQERKKWYYLRGAIVIRTHDERKNVYKPLFLHTIVGPD